MVRESYMKKKLTRDASVKLSVSKVRMFLAERGIFRLRDFEIDYDQRRGEKATGIDGTPKKVWYGKTPISKSKAMDLAGYFGLENYFPLLMNSKSPWEDLVSDSEREESFMTFHVKDPGQLGLVEFENCDNEENEITSQHKIQERFYFTLTGEKGDNYFILIKTNDSQFDVLAPVDEEDYKNCKNRNTGGTLRYPQDKGLMKFDAKEGGGFREIIAIKTSKIIPFHPVSKHMGSMISRERLDAFALNLLLAPSHRDTISVSKYRFVLVE